MGPPARPSRLPVSLRVTLAVASVAVAAALTTGPGGERLFPEAPERFVHGVTLLYAAAVLSAWLGGMGPGLLAALLAALVVDWFITPRSTRSPSTSTSACASRSSRCRPSWSAG